MLRNTAIWVILVPLAGHRRSAWSTPCWSTGPGSRRLAKALIFLPMAISLVGAIDHLEVRLRVPAGPAGDPADRPGQPDPGLAGLEPQQFLLNDPVNTFFLIVVMIWIQAGFAMTVLSAAIKAIPDDITEAARLDGVGGSGCSGSSPCPSIRPALVVVLTTIAIGTLKVFDIVRTMTGGQFNTSVVANEFYTQSFRLQNTGLGAALAVMLFVLVIPIIVYNVRQLRTGGGDR